MAVKHKSRSLRRVSRKLPGGKVTIQYKKRKPGRAKCSNCGKALMGVPRELPSKMRNLAKTKKRPERPYGGVLCSKCMRSKIKEELRK